MKKKLMIALMLATFTLIVGIMAQAGTTGGAEMAWETMPTTVLATESSTVTAEAEAESVSETDTTLQTTTLQESTSASSTRTSTATRLPSDTSASNAMPAPIIAPVAPPPATAAQTTTTTRYVSPQTNAITTTSTTTRYVPPVTAPTMTTTRLSTSTTQFIPPTTTTTTTTQTHITQPRPDFEAMGQATYQEEAIRALNTLRAEKGLPPMTINPALMANSLAHANVMAAAGRAFHTEVNLPGCESVCRVPDNFPAKLMGETLARHTPQFLEASRTSVGIAVVRNGNQLYAVMQGN